MHSCLRELYIIKCPVKQYIVANGIIESFFNCEHLESSIEQFGWNVRSSWQEAR